jgi:hypothetical protein
VLWPIIRSKKGIVAGDVHRRSAFNPDTKHDHGQYENHHGASAEIIENPDDCHHRGP